MLFSQPAAVKTAVFSAKQERKDFWSQASHRISEATVWVIVLVVLVGVRLLPVKIFDDESTLWLAGLIIAFALAYYSVIYRHFSDKQRHYIKDIADVLFIGILGTVAKDHSIYFFTLYILPIAAAAMALDILNSLLVATFASLFIAGNIILNTRFFADAEPLYFGTFQIVLLVLLTFFTRALALQLRSERSERSFFEQKLRTVDKKLEDVEAIEQEFVSITTHQLNTPLSIIRGYSSLLLGGDAGKLSTKQHRYVKEIHAGTLWLTKLIKDLLDTTRLEHSLPMQEAARIRVSELVNQSIRPLATQGAAKGVKLIPSLPKEQLIVKGNTMQLQEAISNLVNNAIKYSPNRTPVYIRVRKEREVGKSNVIINVEDSGIGIPAQEQERIFQRFYRASNSSSQDTRGSGLGLYIVKRIIENHEGSISFNSELNQGTRFQVRLPLVK